MFPLCFWMVRKQRKNYIRK